MATLTLTFQNGDTAEFPFHTGSQLSVTTPDGVNGNKYGSWGEVTGITLSDDPAPVAPVEAPAEPPVAETTPEPDPATLATPADAIAHATGLPLDDAHAHIVTALETFPDNADLLTAKADIEAAQAAAAEQTA
jgi:hypothetical protein